MPTIECPTLFNVTNEKLCVENFAGVGSTGYIFKLDDIEKSKLVAVENVYAWTDDTFKEGKGFYKVELKSESQNFVGESNGNNKGFKITGTQVIEVVDETVGKLLRGLNNIKWGMVIADGDEGRYQILYSPTQKIKLDAGALKTDTGTASGDDRVATLTPVLSPVKYPNLFLTFPTGKTPEDYIIPEN